MAIIRVRTYFDGIVPSDKTLDEINKEIEYWDKVSEELTEWIDPDLN